MCNFRGNLGNQSLQDQSYKDTQRNVLRKRYVKHSKHHTNLQKEIDLTRTICINSAQIHPMTKLQKMEKRNIAATFIDFNAFFKDSRNHITQPNEVKPIQPMIFQPFLTLGSIAILQKWYEHSKLYICKISDLHCLLQTLQKQWTQSLPRKPQKTAV